MNLKSKRIVEEYRELRPDFQKFGEMVVSDLKRVVGEAGIEIQTIEFRVKKEDSLIGKLSRKGDKYTSLSDITDILGVRIICFFADDVDKVAAILEKMFFIDWENSVDKRAQLSPDTFGYLALHYICAAEAGLGYPKKMCGMRFEVQMFSMLQHVWNLINHGLGYKSEFGVPRRVTRKFSRVAGLLEIADDEFMSIRDNVKEYSNEIRERIANNTADDVELDLVSLREFVFHNKEMRGFLLEIADLCDAKISDIDPESYLVQLRWLGKTNIGDLQNMLKENRKLAYGLAVQSLQNADLDILSTNMGLKYLCRAELLNKGYTREKIIEFLKLSLRNADRAEKKADRLLHSKDFGADSVSGS